MLTAEITFLLQKYICIKMYFCNGKDHIKVFGGTINGEIFKYRGRSLAASCG